MNARTRTALIAGIGVAIPTLIFSILGSPLCGPIFAILGGLNVGLMIGRNQTEHPREIHAAGMVSITTGAIMSIGQLAGLLIFFATPSADLVYSQLSAEGFNYSHSFILILVLIIDIIISIIDVGVIMGVALLTTYIITKRLQDKQENGTLQRSYTVPTSPRPSPPKPPATPTPTAPPPPYPPPPDFYGPPH